MNAKSLILFALVAATSARAEIIGWNLDRYGGLSAANFAGVVSASNWNNSFPSDPTVNLVNNAGVATTLDISYSSYNQWSVNGQTGPSPGQDADGTYNRNLLNGYLSAGPAAWSPPITQSSVTLSQVPFSLYNVIVYFSSDGAGREGQVSIGSTTYYFSTVGLASVSGTNAVFAQTTSTSNLVYTTANYAVFTGLSGVSQTMTVQMRDNDEWGGIAGFQIVAVPEPSLVAAAMGGFCLVALFVRRRKA